MHHRNLGPTDRAPRPVFIADGGPVDLFGLCGRVCGRDGGPGSALFHPVGQRLQVGGGKFPFGGHFEALPADRLQQQTFVGLCRVNSRAIVAPLQQPGPRVELQPSLDSLGGLGRVALKAVLNQEWPDPGFEEFELFERGGRWVFGSLDAGSLKDEQQRQPAEPKVNPP